MGVSSLIMVLELTQPQFNSFLLPIDHTLSFQLSIFIPERNLNGYCWPPVISHWRSLSFESLKSPRAILISKSLLRWVVFCWCGRQLYSRAPKTLESPIRRIVSFLVFYKHTSAIPDKCSDYPQQTAETRGGSFIVSFLERSTSVHPRYTPW